MSLDPRVTLTGLAKYMMASSSQQRKILRDYKYPKPEAPHKQSITETPTDYFTRSTAAATMFLGSSLKQTSWQLRGPPPTDPRSDASTATSQPSVDT